MLFTGVNNESIEMLLWHVVLVCFSKMSLVCSNVEKYRNNHSVSENVNRVAFSTRGETLFYINTLNCAHIELEVKKALWVDCV